MATSPTSSRLRLRWLLLLPIVAMVVLQQLVVEPDASCRECKRAATLLRSSGTLRPELTKVLEPALRELAPGREVVLNGEYRSGALMVYLTDIDLLAAREGGTRIGGHRLSEIARNNFVAVSPNMIVVDDAFLGMLIASALNDMIVYAQLMIVTMNIEIDLETRLSSPQVQLLLQISEMSAAASTYQQYTNLKDITSTPEMRGRLRTAGAEMTEAWDGLEAYRRRAGAKSNHEISQTILVTALGPVIAHELGHLDSGQGGQLAASGLLGMTSALTQRDAERRADAYTARFIEQRLKSLRRSNSENRLLFLTERQPLFWFVKFLRELALAEAFRDFRGMDARDALMSIEHKGCVAPPAQYPIAAGDFWRSEQNIIPVVTESEWRTFRARLLQRRQTASHDDALTRARAMIAKLSPTFDSAGAVIDEQMKFIRALTDDDSSILARERWPCIGVKTSTIMQRFSLAKFERAAGFGANRTHVAVIPGGGYVEVRGENEIEYLRAVMTRPMHDAAKRRVYLENTILLAEVAASLLPDRNADVKDLLRPLFITDAECRWNSRQIVVGDVGLRFHRLNDSDYFVLEAMHRSKLPEVRLISERELAASR